MIKSILLLLVLTYFDAFAVVTLLSPANNYDCQDPASVIFSWQPYSQNVQSYQLKVSRFQNLSNPVVDTGGFTSTNVVITLPSGGEVRYYWRVTAIISLNPLVFDTSEVWTFTTMPNPPNTVSPSTNATCQPLRLNFRWSTINNQLTYRLQVATNPLFFNLVKDTIVFTNQATLTLPNYNTKYYWRVLGTTNYNCTTHYSKVDSFRTNRIPPTLLQPSRNATSIWGPVTFVWEVPDNANTYNLQITTDSTFSLILHDEITNSKSFTKQINDFNTVLYWRVKAVYSDCETDFSEVRRFRTAYDKPQDLSPANDTSCFPNQVNFAWGGVSGASSYRLQVSLGREFRLDSLVVDTLLNRRSFSYYFDKSLQYYTWRVRAEDKTNSGLWSDTFRFQTTFAPPKIVSPPNTSETSVSVVFKWKIDQPRATFEFQVSDTSDFRDFRRIIFDYKGLSTDSIALKMPRFNKKYFWRVRASDAFCISSWSATSWFKTKLQAPVNTFPPNNSTKLPLRVQFEWEKPEGATNYQIQVSPDPQFRNIEFGLNGILTNSVVISGLEPVTKYFWRVRALNDDDTSRWSNVFNFTTGPNPLEIPVLYYPTNNASEQPTTLRFVWSKIPRATYYELQLSNDLNFHTIVHQIKNITDTSYVISNLSTYTDYFWRVQAYNDSTTSLWSAIWRFRTVPPVPQGPVLLIQPYNETTGLGTVVTLYWTSIQYSYYYHLQVSKEDPDFKKTNLVVDDSVLINHYRYITDLEYNKKYYWHVRAYNSAGSTPWSDTWWFKTMVSDVEEIQTPYLFSFNEITKTLLIHIPKENCNSANIEIFDLLGNRWVRKDFVNSANIFEVSCSNLPNGAYIVRFYLGGKYLHTLINIY
ncbi:MAG: hypothetical protein N2517_06180 [Ignavibacteria bacterium]|nr:hypothetical protein [Ignavibacteria bacterium]